MPTSYFAYATQSPWVVVGFQKSLPSRILDPPLIRDYVLDLLIALLGYSEWKVGAFACDRNCLISRPFCGEFKAIILLTLGGHIDWYEYRAADAFADVQAELNGHST